MTGRDVAFYVLVLGIIAPLTTVGCAGLAQRAPTPSERLDAEFYIVASDCQHQIETGVISSEHRAACSVFFIQEEPPTPAPSATKRAPDVGPQNGGGVRSVE